MTPSSRRRAYERPHVAAQFDVDAGGRLVEEQDARFVRQRLGDHHAALHAARERHDLRFALVPQRKVAQRLFDDLGIRPLAGEAATEGDGRLDRLERVERQLLRHEADQLAGAAVIRDDVVPARADGAGGRVDDAADDRDQRGLAGAVGAEQREDLARLDREVDGLQGLEPRLVGLGQAGDGDDGH